MPDLTLDIDFIHIGDTEEYRQYRNLERVFLYDLVRIRHAPTGFVAKAQVSGYEWDALTKRYKSITVGNVFAVESSAVAGYQLTEGAVTATKIAPGSVSGSSLRELSVTNAKIAHAAVGTANIQDAAITRAQIADAAVGTAQIGLAAITQALIGAEAVGTTQIADGSITDAKIVNLTANKINAGTLSVERLELVGSRNSVVYALNNSGDLVSQNVDTLDGDVLTERSITGDKIVANAITANESPPALSQRMRFLPGRLPEARLLPIPSRAATSRPEPLPPAMLRPISARRSICPATPGSTSGWSRSIPIWMSWWDTVLRSFPPRISCLTASRPPLLPPACGTAAGT